MTGFIRLDMIDLHDLNSTVKGCTGMMGVQASKLLFGGRGRRGDRGAGAGGWEREGPRGLATGMARVQASRTISAEKPEKVSTPQ